VVPLRMTEAAWYVWRSFCARPVRTFRRCALHVTAGGDVWCRVVSPTVVLAWWGRAGHKQKRGKDFCCKSLPRRRLRQWIRVCLGGAAFNAFC